MAARGEVKPKQGRPPSGRERMIFYVDADLYDWVKAVPRRSDLLNRLLRAERARASGEGG